MWALKTILCFVMFWLLSVSALANPIWGVVCYLLVYQIHPKDTWWGRPLVDMGMRFSLLAISFIVVGMYTGRKHAPQFRPSVSLWEWGLLAMVAFAALGLVTGYAYNSTSGYAFEKFWKMSVFVLILGRLGSSRQNLNLVLWSLVAGSLYIGHDAYNAPMRDFLLGRLDRVGGPDFSTTSGTAAHLSAMLPIIGLMFLLARHWYWRVFALLAGGLTFNAVILCRTRSAFIGLFCGVLAALLTAPRVRRFRIHFLLIGGAIMAFSLTDDHFWERMGTLTDKSTLTTDSATVTRSAIWGISLRMLADYPFGVGTGNFPSVVGFYDYHYHKRASHNSIIVCFTELGLQGGMIFVSLIFGSLWFLYESNRLADETDDPVRTKLLAYGLLVALITYVVSGLGTERFYCESFWWVLVFPLCLHRIVVREACANAEMPALATAEDGQDEYALAAGL